MSSHRTLSWPTREAAAAHNATLDAPGQPDQDQVEYAFWLSTEDKEVWIIEYGSGALCTDGIYREEVILD